MRKNQQGATLVELMVSLVLGLLVTGLAVQLLLQARHGQSSQQATSYFQESVRYVMHRLGPLLRNVGYVGCNQGRQLQVASELHGGAFDISTPFGGSQASYRGHSYWVLGFVVAEKSGRDASLSEAMSAPDDALVIGGFADAGHRADFADALNLAKVALVTNCDSADVFRLGSAGAAEAGDDGVRLVTEAALSDVYGGNAGGMASSYVYPLRRWELRLRDQAGGAGKSALFLVNPDAPTATRYVELVSGIQDYAVTVSLDTDDDGQPDALNQEPASLTDDSWRDVVRVELAFSLRSQPGVVPGGADDGRLTREFQLAFSPRNLPLR